MECDSSTAVMANHNNYQQTIQLRAGPSGQILGACSPSLEALGQAAFRQASAHPPKQTSASEGEPRSRQVLSEANPRLTGSAAKGPPSRSEAGTADEPSKILSVTSDGPEPIRPQAVSLRAGEVGSGGTAAAAADWQCNSLTAKNCEGSATSDEDHPRLVPRRGAGPDLRSSGREIDEYLMRLLHAGSVTASEAAFYQNQAPDHPAPTSLAFPAGWNNARPWFEAAGQQQAAARAGGSGGSGSGGAGAGGGTGVRPAMPPPPFPAQPWQGSRLGPLPPLGPFPAAANLHLDEATQIRGESSCGGAVSEGGTGNGMSEGESQQRPPTPSASAPQQQQQQQPSSTQWLLARVGEAGLAKLGATMLSQQDTLQQQVADLHRLVKRQTALMEEAAATRAAAAARTEAQRQKPGGWPGDAQQDPQTVLVSNLGGGASGSVPSSNASAGATGARNGASSGDLAAASGDDGGGGGSAGASRETLRVAALAHRSQQLRRGGLGSSAAPPAARGAPCDGKRKRPSLDSNVSEQLELGSGVTCQQLQDADARLRSASLELSQQGRGSLGGGSPLVVAMGGGSLVRAALHSLQQQQQTAEALQSCGGSGEGSAQQQHAAFAQQSFMAAAEQRHFQEQLMLSAMGQQAGPAWFAEAIRQMQQQSCMAAFDPRFFPWFYQSNMATMNGFNGFNPGMPGGGMWQPGMGPNMFAMGASGDFNMQTHAAKPSTQGTGMCDGHSMHPAEQEQPQDDRKSAASQGSARISSPAERPCAASAMQEAASGSVGDEATSSLANRGKKRKK